MIYILIPTRNRKRLLKKCLDSIYSQTYKDYKVIIINDGSTDGTRELIRKNFNKAEVLEGDGNLWWTGCMRKGVDYVLSIAKDRDYILLQNDDTYMKIDYLYKLIKIAQKDKKLIIGTAVKDFYTKKLIYNSHTLLKGSVSPVVISNSNNLLDTYTLSGRGVLVPMGVFKKVGSFSKLFPQYASDYEFFCRAKNNGFRLVVTNEIVTYTTNKKVNLSKRIKSEKVFSLKDFSDLFFSRRSSNSLKYSILFTLLCVPFPINVYGIIRIKIYFIKCFVYNLIVLNLVGGKEGGKR